MCTAVSRNALNSIYYYYGYVASVTAPADVKNDYKNFIFDKQTNANIIPFYFAFL